MPWYFRLAGKLKLNRFSLSSPPLSLVFYAFGVKEKSDKELLTRIVRETNSLFLRWAIDKIVNWKNMISLPNVSTIHGMNDRLFPERKADYAVNDGGHFMIVNKAADVSMLIKKCLSD